MTTDGVDYSGARPSDDDIKNHGYKFVIRYLTAPGDSRGITHDEFTRHVQAGVPVALVDEEGAGDHALKGYQQGHVDGENSRMRGIALGWPFNRPIYGATDRDISGTQLPIAGEYYRGFRDGLGEYPAGAYGGKLLLQYLKSNGIVQYAWSSNASSWDHGAIVPGLNLQQHWSRTPPISDTDVNTSYTADFGQYPFTSLPTDWLDMATKEEVQAAFKGALMDPEVARSMAYWITNVAAAQGNPDALPGASIQTIDAKLGQIISNTTK